MGSVFDDTFSQTVTFSAPNTADHIKFEWLVSVLRKM